ncbi:MAG: ribonuclease Z [Bacteroidota bacterium]|nr:ribonuclease Z [Bacteroidota bacterium]
MNLQRFELLILGCSSAVPYKGRSPTAQILNIHDQLFLIDCGEGTQNRMMEYQVKRSKINHIFISHLHGDHIFGLPGLINTYSHYGRKEDLHIYGPIGIQDYIDAILQVTHAHLSYKINFHNLTDASSQTIYEDAHLSVKTIPLKHRIPTLGYLFTEKKGERSLNLVAIQQANIKPEDFTHIISGKDVMDPDGKCWKADELSIPASKPRSYAFCSDTKYTESILPYITNVNVLYHETTFLDELKQKAIETGHSTALEAAMIAKKAQVNLLVSGHYSSRYDDLSSFESEMRTIFSSVILGKEGMRIDIV